LPLLRLSIPIGWRLRLLREIFTQQTQAPNAQMVNAGQMLKRLRLNGNLA